MLDADKIQEQLIADMTPPRQVQPGVTRELAGRSSRLMKSPALASLLFTTALAFGLAPGAVDHALSARAMVVTQARVDKVTHVIDGDSLRLGNREVRLAGIDAPEYQQPYGRTSRRILHELVHGRRVRLQPVDRHHGRIVAHVYREDGLHVNATMVARGAAHVYRRYTNDPRLIALEDDARRSKKGLWALPSAQRLSPEQWRRKHETRHD